MSELNLIKVDEMPVFLDKALTPASQEIGQTLGNIFYAVFSPLNYPIEKLRIKQAESLKKYEKNIQLELDKIPEEKLIDPPLNIVGPALEASKFYIEEEDTRKMFAKLIASSMNKDNTENTHPAFIEIIKQLSPLDAIAFKSLSKSPIHPMISYRIDEKSMSSKGIEGNVVLENLVQIEGIEEDGYKLIPTIVDNLSRLGLINATYNSPIASEPMYEKVINYFDKTAIPFIENYYLAREHFRNREIYKMRGVLELTSFGINFIKTCID